MNGDEQRARAALDRVGLGWAAAAIRATSRAASASGSRSRRSPSRSRTCSSWTSRRGASIPSGRPRSARWLEEYAASGKAVAPRDPRPRPARAPPNRTLCFRNTSALRGALRWRLGSPRSRPGRRSRSPPGRRSTPPAAGSRRCSPPSPCSLAGFAWLEGGTVSARDLTLVATLGGLAAAGRVLFAPIPSVQPVTVIVAAAGVALGPRRGFAVGALAAIASNFFLGQGPHTPWQMLAWGGCGLLAGAAAPAAAPPARLRRLHARARLRVRDGDGRLALARLLPAHRGGAARAPRRRAFPSTSRTRPGTSCSRSSRGRS